MEHVTAEKKWHKRAGDLILKRYSLFYLQEMLDSVVIKSLAG
jgi:hypothetical protein